METPSSTPNMKEHLNALEKFFDTYLHQKAPFHLPKGAKDFIVQYGPWITLIVLIFGALTIIPLILFMLSFSAAVMPYAVMGGYHYGSLGILNLLIGIAVLVMEAIAIPGLLKRKLSGWHMAYYAALLSALGQLISLNIVGLIIGLVISMYILFQIREYYH